MDYLLYTLHAVCVAGVQRESILVRVCMTCTYSPSTRLCNYFALALHTPAPNVMRAQPFCQMQAEDEPAASHLPTHLLIKTPVLKMTPLIRGAFHLQRQLKLLFKQIRQFGSVDWNANLRLGEGIQ